MGLSPCIADLSFGFGLWVQEIGLIATKALLGSAAITLEIGYFGPQSSMAAAYCCFWNRQFRFRRMFQIIFLD
jgi:hypothetical protein